MARLHLVVEGQTEETFVRDVLVPHLAASQVYADARCLATGRRRGRTFKGGLVNYAHLRSDLLQWIRQDTAPDVWFTTMVDLYRLPAEFPGREDSRTIKDPLAKVLLTETCFARDIGERRFIPYVQLHEFEALLFCDLGQLAQLHPAHEPAIRKLEREVRGFPSPEHIDEGADTSPAKRILKAIPPFAKTVDGPLATKALGLGGLESRCAHFHGWLCRLRELGAPDGTGKPAGI